jgi:RNA ligase
MMKAIQTILGLLRDQTFTKNYQNLIAVTKDEGDLILLNYTDLCQRRQLWDEVSLACRGLILNTKTGEVVAYPFPKFFNYEEYHQKLPNEAFSVTEKMDGSLGILYRSNGELRLATRGSFSSPEAMRGTQLLQKFTQKIPDAWTLLFEIIIPGQGAHIVRYTQETLVLLGGFDRLTGEELPWVQLTSWAQQVGYQTPKEFTFKTIDEVLAQRSLLPVNQEGFVLRFSGGLRLKIKGDAYLNALQKSLGISRAKVLEVLLKGDSAYLAFLRKAPEEMQPDIQRLGEELKKSAASLETEATKLFSEAPNPKERGMFQQWVQKQSPHLQAALTDLGNGKKPRWYRLLSSS